MAKPEMAYPEFNAVSGFALTQSANLQHLCGGNPCAFLQIGSS